MSPQRRQIGKILELADRIEADICRRELKPGDRYLSTVDAARMLRVDTTDANRALQLLVKRNRLERRQRTGTFIARQGSDGHGAVLDTLHVLTYDRQVKAEGLLDTGTVLGLQSQLPGVPIRFDFVPALDESEYMEQLIADVLRTRHSEGFVLLNSNLMMQRLVGSSGLPAVVFGHPYPSMTGLPFVDRDQRQVGRLLAEYVLGRGHRRIVLLARQRLLPGDHVAFDAVRDAMHEAGLPAGALTLRCLPSDREVVFEEVRRLVQESEDLPGVLARPAMMADMALAAIESLGLAPHAVAAVAVADYYGPEVSVLPYPVIRPTLDYEQQGALLGRLLVQQARGERLDPDHELIPVRLEIPQGKTG